MTFIIGMITGYFTLAFVVLAILGWNVAKDYWG